MDDFAALFAGMPEEEKAALMEQLMGMGGLDEQSQMLERQIAQANALGPPQSKSYGGKGLTGPLGAFANILEAHNWKRDRDQGRADMRGLIDQKTAGRKAFADLLGRKRPMFDVGGVESPLDLDDGYEGLPDYLRR